MNCSEIPQQNICEPLAARLKKFAVTSRFGDDLSKFEEGVEFTQKFFENFDKLQNKNYKIKWLGNDHDSKRDPPSGNALKKIMEWSVKTGAVRATQERVWRF